MLSHDKGSVGYDGKKTKNKIVCIKQKDGIVSKCKLLGILCVLIILSFFFSLQRYNIYSTT